MNIAKGIERLVGAISIEGAFFVFGGDQLCIRDESDYSQALFYAWGWKDRDNNFGLEPCPCMNTSLNVNEKIGARHTD